MTDIKRLHEVHYQYPNVPRRGGKTTYCFDSLLRAAQTGEYYSLAYITNTKQASLAAQKDFQKFLVREGIMFSTQTDKVILENCTIYFENRHIKFDIFDGVVEDYFTE